MKIVNIIGGLGNQMFQYAFALSLKNRFPHEEVLIDTSHFNYIFVNRIGTANLHNGFEIDKVFPNASLKIASSKQLMKVSWYIPNYLLSRIARRILPCRKTEYIQPTKEYFTYDPLALSQVGDCYYEGIWESISYYLSSRDFIREIYAHPEPNRINADYISAMENENSVGIHIRRGDYLKSPELRGICDLEYYRRAIDWILSDELEHTFYIFSNDINWCDENIRPLIGNSPIIMVTENTGANSCWDMFLMTHCKDLIIANSSFSWWAAFLNDRKGRVVAPKKWFNRDAEFDIWASEWIKM